MLVPSVSIGRLWGYDVAYIVLLHASTVLLGFSVDNWHFSDFWLFFVITRSWAVNVMNDHVANDDFSLSSWWHNSTYRITWRNYKSIFFPLLHGVWRVDNNFKLRHLTVSTTRSINKNQSTHLLLSISYGLKKKAAFNFVYLQKKTKNFLRLNRRNLSQHWPAPGLSGNSCFGQNKTIACCMGKLVDDYFCSLRIHTFVACIVYSLVAPIFSF